MKKSLLLFFFGVLLLIGFFWIYFPTLTRYRDLKLEEDNLGKDLTGLEFKIDDLREEKDLLMSDREYIEKVIREELGLVKPGETVYKFVEDEPLKLEELLPVEEPAKPEEKKIVETKTQESEASKSAPGPVMQPQVEPEPTTHYDSDTLPEFRIVEEVDEDPLPAVSGLRPIVQQPVPLLIPRTEQPKHPVARLRPYPSENSGFKKAAASGTEKFVSHAAGTGLTPRAARVTLRPTPATQMNPPKPKYKPKLLRQYPPPESDTEEFAGEGESLFERLKNEVTSLFSQEDEEEVSYGETSSLHPVTKRKLEMVQPVTRTLPSKTEIVPVLPRRISKPLPVAQPKEQISPLAARSMYPRQETR